MASGGDGDGSGGDSLTLVVENALWLVHVSYRIIHLMGEGLWNGDTMEYTNKSEGNCMTLKKTRLHVH